MILSGANGINGGGVEGCPSITLCTTNPTWIDMVVTQVIRDDKPATDEYPICKTAQTHPEK
jgi:hypothetical protein